MATPCYSTSAPSDYWQEIENEINSAFGYLIQKIQKRQAALLDKLRYIRTESKDIPELIRQMKEQLSEMETEKSKATREFHFEQINTLEEGLGQYQFVWNGNELEQLLESLGDIVKFPETYYIKNIPKITFGTEPIPGICLASGFAVSEKLGLIAVGELETESVLIYNMQGMFVNNISDKQMVFPNSIAFGEETAIYVADYHKHSIFKFSANNSDFAEEINLLIAIDLFQFEYGFITSLDFDSTSQCIYGTLEKYHKILIFDSELTLNDIFNPGLQFPQDIKVKQHQLFVLDYSNPCFHVISKSTQTKLFSIIPRGSEFKLNSPQHFTIDENSNIFLTDIVNHQILMYTHSGYLVLVMFKSGKSRGEIFVPAGIHVTNSNEIIVLSQNDKHPVQIF